MYLKSLTLRGFKSFASATTMAFEPGITAIVGPNGSGKSNVVDALAWVMGEQGAKSLRGVKMEDVIFAGTAGRLALGRAEVSLTIDNTDGVLPIDYTEVTISRTLFRNGGSEYAINGHSCRLLDVQDLLSDTGMGREMHVIVGQGQLDQILRATPEQRRGFIEEAAGVLKHRRRKEKAVRKLESTQANVARLTDLVTEIRRQLKPLGRQARVAKRAAVIQAELRDAKARLLADDLTTLRESLESERAKETERQRARARAQEALDAAREAEREADRILAACYPAQQEAQELWYRLAGLAERVTTIQSISAERQRLASRDPQVRRGRDPEELEAEAAQAEEEERRLAADVEAASHALDDTSQARAAAERDEARAEGEYARRLRAIADHREGLAKLEGQIGALRSRLEASGDEIERLVSRRAEQDDQGAQAQQDYAKVETQLASVLEGESGLDARWTSAEEARDRARDEVERLTDEHRDATSRIDALQARIEALQMGRRDASKALAERPGVLGPLGSLVKIPSRWQVAVSAALGARAESVAVEEIATAFDALAELKSRNLGRAGMAIARPTLAPHAWGDPGHGAQWAVDVCSVPNNLSWAITRLLSRVVLADSLEQAQRVVEDRDDVTAVTQTGDIISSWYAAGGSDSGQSAIEIEAAIDETREQLDASHHEAERLAFQLKQATQTLDEAEKTYGQALEALNASDAEMSALTEQLSALAQRARNAQKQSERFAASIEEAGRKRQADEERLAQLSTRLDDASADDLVEPDPEARDRAVALGRHARSAEMEARLALRTAEERARSVAGRATSLRNAASRERAQRAQAEAQRVSARREAAVARCVNEGATWLGERVAAALGKAGQRKTELEASRLTAEKNLAEAREVVRARSKNLDEVTNSDDRLERVTLELKVEQLEARIADELAMSPQVLIDEYSPQVPIPVLVGPDGAALGEDDLLPPVAFDRREQEKRLKRAQSDLRALGKINPLALEEFDALNERHEFLATQLADVKKTRSDLLGIIDDVDTRVQEVFTEAFADVARTFADVFSRLFPGGEGALVLTNPEDMLETGIDVEARPAGKKVKRLSLLSGGERSLVAVAFLISLFIARPSPFYILDEVEAALDDVNLGRLLGIYEELRKTSQLLIITHQKRTMQIADALYGVTMRGDGVSSVISQRLVES